MWKPNKNNKRVIFNLSGSIPRTLIGRNGARLYDIPGVIYPRKMLNQQSHHPHLKKEILQTMPDWAITTKQASHILRCGRSHTRALLHRRNICSCYVQLTGGRICTCWHKIQVMQLAEQRNAPPELPIEQLLSIREATQLVGVSRSTFTRYVKLGLLKRYSLRRQSPGMGQRINSFFKKSQVEHLLTMRKYIFSKKPRRQATHAPENTTHSAPLNSGEHP
ncbi:MAG: hypothetical protein IJN29_01535 [Akkermansia sp.]|nr:hypothetical protein [Akkermansia sp.]